MMIRANDSTVHSLPPLGDNPSTQKEGTTPGSFAAKGKVGTAWTFSSPDTPGMPQPSEFTAWDFLPDGWSVKPMPADTPDDSFSPYACTTGSHPSVTFRTALGEVLQVSYPANFEPITQLESARLGVITPQLRRVAEREGHLTPQQVRDE